MKRFYFIIVLALVTASCSQKIDSVFSQSASERLSAFEQECLDLLLSSENGWLIQYYPSSTREYGGFSLAAVFDDSGNVTIASDSDPYSPITSHYSINTANNVCLTFDTYNEYIHYYSDPDYSGSNEFGGDFEFAFLGGDSEELTFRGIKTGNTIKFTALETDIVTAAEQIMNIKEALEDNLIAMYESPFGTKLERQTRGYNLIAYTQDPDDSYSTITIPYAYSENGMTFYEAVEIDGVLVQDFTWDESTLTFTSNEDSWLQLKGTIHDNYRSYEDYIGTYTFVYYDQYYGTDISRAVTLTQNVAGSTYTLSDISVDYGYSVVVDYSPYGYYLTIYSQYVGTFNNYYYIWFCPVSSDGYVTWSTSAGVNIVNRSNNDAFIVMTFEDDGAWGPEFMLYAFYSSTPSSSTAAGYLEYMTPYTLVKIN